MDIVSASPTTVWEIIGFIIRNFQLDPSTTRFATGDYLLVSHFF